MAPKDWTSTVGRRPSYRLWGLLALAFILIFFITPVDKLRSLRPESLKELENYSYKLPEALHPQDSVGDADQARIGLVSMAYGNDTAVYDRAIESHARHAARHKYPLFVLRREVAEGYWSKTLYLISLLIQELAKPESTRLEWLMWFDADSVVLNREIPLEVFVPDKSDAAFDNTNVVSAHDQWGMNTGIFFTRVHPRSVAILTKAFGYPTWRPEEDLQHAYDQRALDLTICSAEFQRNVLWVPRPFFNARHEEVVPGTMFVHFYSDTKRPEHMQEWLEKGETGRDADMQIPYNESYYPAQVDQFWSTARECRSLVQLGQDSIKSVQDQTLRKVLQENLARLESACIWKTEDVANLKVIIDEVKLATHW
ncbi:hypothetical protein A1O3_06040 [Capronia epimyces CBS 606.96]|uniref:Galactosyl transferase GMA12/MNN10 family protein n=1 Tax=Capronia epimyces CBS 606.96 TaxID=1182542 RepID=W9XNU9_9EURO|nr:uncharacterized protein A1O3_06040 [Capronia epimyces CBS 606.96]EXJ82227.1 hypothetical protein A1O3_06040 [Capronia epimyces CBS 606.96]